MDSSAGEPHLTVLTGPEDEAPRPRRPSGGPWHVRNRTGHSITLKAGRAQFVVPPLTTVTASGADVERFGMHSAELQDELEVVAPPVRPPRDLGALFRVLAAVVVAFLVFGWNVVAGKSTFFSVVYWTVSSSVMLLAGTATYLLYRRRGLGEAGRWVSQAASLCCILAIGAGVPLVTAFRFGDGEALLRGEPTFALLARVEVTLLAVIASVMPALLYFVFDRQALSTVRRRIEQQIFRFDPRVRTIEDLQARMGPQMDEAFGAPSATGSARLAPGTRLPLLIATLTLALGWVLTLQPASIGPSVRTADDLAQALRPEPTALVFGFLGAYYFAINLIVRRYMRGDLKPKAYSMIASRILVVAILAWLLDEVAPGNAVVLLVAFVAGIIPETAFTYLREVTRDKVFQGRMIEAQPLTMLEGVDLYDRSGLEDEGVMNLEALVHHDLYELILTTRIPPERLVDFVDQAILMLHLPMGLDPWMATSGAGAEDLATLRQFGIRTASDLEHVVAECERRWGEPGVKALLETFDRNRRWPSGVVRYEVILDAIAKGEWMENVRYWHSKAGVAERIYVVQHDVRASEPREPEEPTTRAS